MAATLTPESIIKDIKAGNVAPVYYLMGDEPYFIDKLSMEIVHSLLSPDDEEFNYDLLYGNEANIDQIVQRAFAFPMMANWRVVLVREAQHLRTIDSLSAYLHHPSPTTVIIFCHKYGKLDARRAVSKQIQKQGIVFESKKLYESQLPGFITKYLRQSGVEAEPQAIQMICSSVGTDLCRVASELDKLLLGLPKGQTRITPQLVETLVGISKDYNAFELIGALARKDVYKSNQIVAYFKSNPRQFALPQVLSNIFTFFSDILTAHYCTNKTPQGYADWLECPAWKVNQDILPALQNYLPKKTLRILDEIRATDAASKGVDGCKTTPGELLQELVFVILH